MRLTLTLSRIEDPDLYEDLEMLAARERPKRLRALLRTGMTSERGHKPRATSQAAPTAPAILDSPELDPRNFSFGKGG